MKKRKAGDLTPSTRSIRYLEASGWVVGDVERIIPYAHIKQDLFGFADLVAMKPGCTPRLIQVTTNDHLAARRTKILNNTNSLIALMSGFSIHIHGWLAPVASRPDWGLRVVEITPLDFERKDDDEQNPRPDGVAAGDGGTMADD